MPVARQAGLENTMFSDISQTQASISFLLSDVDLGAVVGQGNKDIKRRLLRKRDKMGGCETVMNRVKGHCAHIRNHHNDAHSPVQSTCSNKNIKE